MKRLFVFLLLASLLVGLLPAVAQSESATGVVVTTETLEGVNLNAFTAAVPAGWLAPPDAGPRYSIALVPTMTSAGVCGYTVRDLNGNVVADVNVPVEQIDVQVTVTDLVAAQPVASEVFRGSNECAASISCSNDSGRPVCGSIYDLPDVDPFTSWLTATMGGLPDLEAARASDIAMVITEPDESIAGAVYDPSGQFVLTYSNDRVSIWDAATGEKVRQIGGHYLFTEGIEYSPDGQFIVTFLMTPWVTIWNATTGVELREVPPPPASQSPVILAVSFSPDGRFLLTREGQNWAAIRDALTGETVRQLAPKTDAYNILSTAYSPDGRFIVTGNSDTTARIWDAATGEEVRRLVGHTGAVRNASYSPDGRFIVTASTDKTARIWDAVTGEELHQLNGHTDEVTRSSYSPDGRFVVTTSSDMTVRIWDVTTGETVRTLSNHGYLLRRASYSPDGRFILAACSDGTAIIWNVADLLDAP